ncbi:MAG: hypothetical protein M1825_003313 [Sarcosagium campestre]|nr:MAG: hypothetical protein M1825_003313 [Sarcosagium campestre]
MFVSCGGLNVLVEFLEEDYEAERDLVLIGGPTPKNDFCRIFSRSSVLYPLSLVLNRVLDEEGEVAELFEGRIVNIFFLFSQAENHVKELVADRMVLKSVLKDLKRMSPQHQVTMLKFIKNLSMLSTTLDSLQNSNAIDVLTDLLSSSMKEPHFREISNQVLNTMYNLCRLSKTRQEDAALNGIIPLLQRIVKTERPLKEFALPILCDMAHSGKVGRKILWQNKGLQFYTSLLSDPYWQVTALDAIFVWLQEETAKVEDHLLKGGFTDSIVKCFTTSKANAFENLLEPLQKLIRLSPLIAQSLGRPDLFSRILQKLRHNKAVIRLNLLRIVRSICDASPEQGGLLQKNGLFEAVQRLAEHDPAVLVKNMASELVKSSERQDLNVGEARKRVLRRASANGPPAFAVSSPSIDGLQQGKSNLPIQSPSTQDLPTKRRINGTSATLGHRSTSRELGFPSPPAISTASTLNVGKSRLPRTSINRSKSTLNATTERSSENKAPKQASTYTLLGSRQRRRQTSTGIK